MMKRIWKSTIAILLVLCLSLGLAACSSKPSEKTFKKAQKEAFEDVVSQLLEGYALTNSSDMATTVNMSVKLSEDLLTTLRSMTGENMDWLNDVSIQLNQNAKDDKMAQELLLGYKGKELLAIKMLSDVAKGDMFVAIPALTKKYLKNTVNNQTNGAGGVVATPAVLLSGDITKYLPSEKVLEKVLYRYYDIIMNGLTGVKFESGKLSAGGVEQDCTVYTLELTPNKAVAVSKQVLEALKTDKDIKDAIYTFANGIIKDGLLGSGVTADDAYNEFTEAIDEALENTKVEEDVDGDAVNVRWTTYMTKKNEVIGTKLEFIDEETIGTIFTGKAQNGEKIGVEVYVEFEGNKIFEIKGDLTEQKQVQNGTYELKVEGESMLFVDVKDLSVKQLEEGCLDGTFKICPSKGLLGKLNINGAAAVVSLASMAIEVDVAQENEQKATMTLTLLNNGASVLSITLDSQLKDATAITLPGDSDVTKEIETWVDSMDANALKNQLKTSGLPTSITDMMCQFVDGFLLGLSHPQIIY